MGPPCHDTGPGHPAIRGDPDEAIRLPRVGAAVRAPARGDDSLRRSSGSYPIFMTIDSLFCGWRVIFRADGVRATSGIRVGVGAAPARDHPQGHGHVEIRRRVDWPPLGGTSGRTPREPRGPSAWIARASDPARTGSGAGLRPPPRRRRHRGDGLMDPAAESTRSGLCGTICKPEARGDGRPGAVRGGGEEVVGVPFPGCARICLQPGDRFRHLSAPRQGPIPAVRSAGRATPPAPAAARRAPSRRRRSRRDGRGRPADAGRSGGPWHRGPAWRGR